MAYGKSYELPAKKQSHFSQQSQRAYYFLSEYVIPFVLGYMMLKIIKVTIVTIRDIFDPDLSEYYYNPDPLWLAY